MVNRSWLLISVLSLIVLSSAQVAVQAQSSTTLSGPPTA
jgi:hypothetical protein